MIGMKLQPRLRAPIAAGARLCISFPAEPRPSAAEISGRKTFSNQISSRLFVNFSRIPTRASEVETVEAPRCAFFDLDNTICRSNIVKAYITFKMRTLSLLERLFFIPVVLVKAVIYLVLDRIDRSWFNRVFYASYR